MFHSAASTQGLGPRISAKSPWSGGIPETFEPSCCRPLARLMVWFMEDVCYFVNHSIEEPIPAMQRGRLEPVLPYPQLLENFWVSFFFKGIPLGWSIRYIFEGSNINISIQILFVLNVHPWQKRFQTLEAKKTILLYLCVWSLLASTSTVNEGLRMETLGWFMFLRYTLEGSNINNMMFGDWRVTVPKINGTKSDGSRMVLSYDFRPPF